MYIILTYYISHYMYNLYAGRLYPQPHLFVMCFSGCLDDKENECTKLQNPRRIQITFVITYVCRVIKFAKLYNVAIIAKIVKSWGIYYYRLSWEFMRI